MRSSSSDSRPCLLFPHSSGPVPLALSGPGWSQRPTWRPPRAPLQRVPGLRWRRPAEIACGRGHLGMDPAVQRRRRRLWDQCPGRTGFWLLQGPRGAGCSGKKCGGKVLQSTQSPELKSRRHREVSSREFCYRTWNCLKPRRHREVSSREFCYRTWNCVSTGFFQRLLPRKPGKQNDESCSERNKKSRSRLVILIYC